MKYYAENIVAALIGCGLIANILMSKLLHTGIPETWNTASLAVGGVMIAGSMISAIYKAHKLGAME